MFFVDNPIATGVGMIYNVHMAPLPAISKNKLSLVRNLYLNKKLCVREIAEHLKVSADAVTSFFRRHNIPKRSYSEAQQVEFNNRPLSFSKQKLNSHYLKELSLVGTMLYWAEGYKGKISNTTIDFANSDPLMIKLFLQFFRLIFKPDEKKIRIYLYCYANQNVKEFTNFWSKLTRVPKARFLKPYVRSDFREDGRKMKHGMVHVRYHDKKLLLEIKSMIELYVKKYMRRSYSGNYTTL